MNSWKVMNKWVITDVKTDEPIMIYSGSFIDVMNFLNNYYKDGMVDVESEENWIERNKQQKGTIMTNIIKPPLGLTPRWIRDMERFEEIISAMKRYSQAGMPIPIEWIEEVDELYDRTVVFETVEQKGNKNEHMSLWILVGRP